MDIFSSICSYCSTGIILFVFFTSASVLKHKFSGYIPHFRKSLSVKLVDIFINRFTFPPDTLSDAPCLQSVEFRFLKFS